MQSQKCPQCGFVTSATLSSCKRCSFDFNTPLKSSFIRKFYSRIKRLFGSKKPCEINKKPNTLKAPEVFRNNLALAKPVSTEERGNREQSRILEIMFMNAVKDGYISDEEIELIKKFYKESLLSEQEYNDIRNRIFKGCVEIAILDRRVPPQEEKALYHIAGRFEIPDETINWMKNKIDYFATLSTLETIPFEQIPISENTNVILQKAETPYFCFPATLYEEKKRILPVSDGRLTITNQRLVFSGERKSVNAPFNKLLDMNCFSDGIRFSLNNRQKPLTLILPEKAADIAGIMVNRLLHKY